MKIFFTAPFLIKRRIIYLDFVGISERERVHGTGSIQILSSAQTIPEALSALDADSERTAVICGKESITYRGLIAEA